MSTPRTEDAVVGLIRRRGAVGREKYRTSMDRRDLSPAQWFQHFQEELADGLQYAERLKRACDLLEEAAHIIGRAAVDSGRGLQWLANYKAQFGEQPDQTSA